MSNLSTQSYKGTRDYFPDDKRVQNYLFNTWKRTVESFGYEEYGAPLLEPLELYTAKSGQELAGEQTYLFEDRGGRQVAIRPEMTPTISRMVAARRQELAMPARLYSIANFMRYERPQRGREREFWQLNADLFGVEGAWADAEIIELSHACVMAFGATQDMFKVRLNNRQLIQQLMSEFLGLDFIGTTMRGYTPETQGCDDIDFDFIHELSEKCPAKIIAEGHIHYPEQAKKALEAGAFALVVGGAITRPAEITSRFVSAIRK